MYNAITDVSGIAVGHSGDESGLTGLTVVLYERGATVGVEVRGRAPGTRETDLCRSGSLVEKAQAILLTGGSAFGLDAAAGAMRYLRERGVGFEAGAVRIPIVPAAVIFDLGARSGQWPTGEAAYDACRTASNGPVAQGCVGVGTGATVGKLLGQGQATKSGVGTASRRRAGLTVGALMAVNAFGNIVEPDTGRIVAGTRTPDGIGYVPVESISEHTSIGLGTNTTIGVVATDAVLTPAQCTQLAATAQDSLVRVIRPVHTQYDGDAIFVLATGTAGGAGSSLNLDLLCTEVVMEAVLNAVRRATSGGGLPSCRTGDD